jgi:hypothetical protein
VVDGVEGMSVRPGHPAGADKADADRFAGHQAASESS